MLIKIGVQRFFERKLLLQSLQGPKISSQSFYNNEKQILFLKGTWREIGKQICESTNLLNHVKDAKAYRDSIYLKDKKSIDEIIEISIENIRENIPDLASLIEGAHGANDLFDVRDYFLANIWPAIAPWDKYAQSCSAAVINAADGPMLAQNLDIGATNNVVLTHIVPENGPVRLCHLMPGYMWFGTGINQFGVTYGGGSVNVNKPFEPLPKCHPSQFINFALMNELKSITEFSDKLLSYLPIGPTHGGMSLVGTDHSGKIVRVDVSSNKLRELSTNSNYAAAMNHFQHSEMESLNRVHSEFDRSVLENSKARYDSFCRQFSSNSSLTTRNAKYLMRNTKGLGAWNRKAKGNDIGWTSASYLIDLAESKLHYILGSNPKVKNWRVLDLDPIFMAKPFL